MPTILIKHRVADFPAWHAAFEAHEPARVAAGETNATVCQDAADPNNVHVIFEMSDLAKAKEFMFSDDLKQKMQAAGVLEAPTVYLLDGLE